MNDLLLYERSAINEGELWRLISAHFIHLSMEHLLINLIGFFILLFIARRYASWGEITALILITLPLISISLYAASPYVERYGGLSGLLYALVGWLGVTMLLNDKKSMGITLLIATGFKVAYEARYGSLTNYETFRVITDVHLYGYGWGVALGALKSYYDKKIMESR